PAPSRAQIAKASIKSRFNRISLFLKRPFQANESEGTAIVKRLFLKSARARVGNHHALFDALAKGLPPLGEHEEMFQFVKSIDRDVLKGIAGTIDQAIGRASFTG